MACCRQWCTYTLLYISHIYLLFLLIHTLSILPGSIRKCSQTYHHNGYIIPKGFSVMASNYNIMRSGINDPDVYRPERWEKGSPDYNRDTITAYTTVYTTLYIWLYRIPFVILCYDTAGSKRSSSPSPWAAATA